VILSEEIRSALFQLQDIKYRDFQSKLMPTVASDRFIGVRTPELRKMAKEMEKRIDIDSFLNNLPHMYFDENQLHAFIISDMKDYSACLERVDTFLPYVDNWATCDQMTPKIFRKNKEDLSGIINKWLSSGRTYTIRFGIKMLMDHFLDESFDPEYPRKVAAIRSEEYYVNMMIAWYFATALAKQYDAVLPYPEERKLTVWTQNKTIQKAVESYRISPEQKEYLRSLKLR